jgi:hypothetical protein
LRARLTARSTSFRPSETANRMPSGRSRKRHRSSKWPAGSSSRRHARRVRQNQNTEATESAASVKTLPGRMPR